MRFKAACGGLLGLMLAVGVHADVVGYCDPAPSLNAAQQDRLLRFAAIVRQQLEAADQGAVLVARAGLELQRFGQRYSHMGISLQQHESGPWTVRQLYYACDLGQARLFDQGLTGFVMGGRQADLGFVSLLLLPDDAAQSLARTAGHKPTALGLLSPRYSANAYAWSRQYQNCNQWVVELLAQAWRQPAAELALPSGHQALEPRDVAQTWLKQQGYQASRFASANPLMWWLAAAIPWLHFDDHPPADLEQGQLFVTMPASIERWVRQRWPSARRIELCHTDRHVVVRQGGEDLSSDCVPGPADQVLPFH